jgi:hypothetical protein
MKMSSKKYGIPELQVFFYYFFIPVFLFTLFSVLYITGSDELREVIAPQVNREFGLLENMQNLLLIAAIAYSIFIYFRMDIKTKLERWVILGLGLLGLLILLEEADYGMHFYDLMMGRPTFSTNIVLKGIYLRNLHNTSFFMEFFRFFKGTLFLCAFCIFVFLFSNKLKFSIIPSKWIIFPILFACFLPPILFYFEIDGLNPEKYHGSQMISELNEVLIYYGFFLYMYECRRQFNPIFTRPASCGMMLPKPRELTSWSNYPESSSLNKNVATGSSTSIAGKR